MAAGRQRDWTSLNGSGKAVTLGPAEILLTSMDADGTQDGFDLDLTRAVAEEVPVPVIASGGAGKLEDFYRVLTEGKADAGPCRVGLPLWNLPYQGSEGLSFKTRRRRAALKKGAFPHNRGRALPASSAKAPRQGLGNVIQ